MLCYKLCGVANSGRLFQWKPVDWIPACNRFADRVLFYTMLVATAIYQPNLPRAAPISVVFMKYQSYKRCLLMTTSPRLLSYNTFLRPRVNGFSLSQAFFPKPIKLNDYSDLTSDRSN